MMSESGSEKHRTGRRRDQLHLAFLEAVSAGPVIQQRIMESAHIKNNEQFKGLKDELLELGWIQVTNDNQYSITKRGVPVLAHLSHTRELYTHKVA